MNTYRLAFTAICPSDNQQIIYSLTVESSKMIHVEHIRAATAQIKGGYHEDIADRLSEMLPGEQTLTATHQGIEVETVRAGT